MEKKRSYVKDKSVESPTYKLLNVPIVLLADRAKSEQAHHCAGMERELTRPRLTMSEATSACSPGPCPSESKGHMRSLPVDSEQRVARLGKGQCSFNPGRRGNAGQRWDALGSGHHACFSFHIVLGEKLSPFLCSGINF